MYLVLVTNKASNILEDLETLRLCGKVVPEYVMPMEEETVRALRKRCRGSAGCSTCCGRAAWAVRASAEGAAAEQAAGAAPGELAWGAGSRVARNGLGGLSQF